MVITQIDTLIQNAISSNPIMFDEYVTWEIFKPSRVASNDFYKIDLNREAIKVGEFMGSYPSQNPKFEVNNNLFGSGGQPETIETSLFVVDVLSLSNPLSNKYLLKIKDQSFLYQVETEVGVDLLEKNIKLEVIRVL